MSVMSVKTGSLLGSLFLFGAMRLNQAQSVPESTAIIKNDRVVENRRISTKAVKDAFDHARSIQFENGMDNEFRRQLINIISDYEAAGVEAIRDLVDNRSTDPEVASMALRYLGAIDHPATYRQRLFVLLHTLKHRLPIVRDGAVLGLDFLGEPEAINDLASALNNEHDIDVREDMQAVLAQLRR